MTKATDHLSFNLLISILSLSPSNNTSKCTVRSDVLTSDSELVGGHLLVPSIHSAEEYSTVTRVVGHPVLPAVPGPRVPGLQVGDVKAVGRGVQPNPTEDATVVE